MRGGHQPIPQIDQFIDVDEVADVVGGSFGQDLLVGTDPIAPIREVVVGTSSPTDVGGRTTQPPAFEIVGSSTSPGTATGRVVGPTPAFRVVARQR